MDKNISDFSKVIELSKNYLNEDSIALIVKAYDYAAIKHAGQKRKTGEPYINHLINVAYILCQLQAGPMTIAAGLLHDTIEDCDVTYDELNSSFGEDIATLVESVTKVKRISEMTRMDAENENQRKIFIATAKDIRVIIIKLADRLHNMRTLAGHNNIETEQRISKETLKVYSPIAHRLGMNTLKSELEDLSLKYLEPEKYLYIKDLLAEKEAIRNATLNTMKERIEKLLSQYHIPYEIHGRVKSIYSIYKKMYVKNRSFDEIYDLQALRIITDTVTQCYEILGYIHAIYTPIPGRFKDYIAMPKPNMYQSLHTSIIADDGKIYEIQIRTKDMDEIAETGIAAHWKYKEGSNYNSKNEQKEIEEQLHWFRDLVNASEESDGSSKDFIETIMKDIFEANVYALTPKGTVIDLPAGATPIDFAYRIHSHVGDATIGAKVNGVLVPLSTKLNTGDVVEIKTSNDQNPIPSEDWLKFVVTNNAKNRIKKALQKRNNEIYYEENVQLGRQLLEEAIRDVKSLDYKEVIKIINTPDFLSNCAYETIEAMYVGIANKNISCQTIVNKVLALNKKFTKITPFTRAKHSVSIDGIIVPGIDSVAVSFSQCCSPIPGDDIVGYIAQGKGIKVHRRDCATIKNKTSRMIEVYWDEAYLNDHPTLHYVDIQVLGQDRPLLLNDIINELSVLKISINSINASVNKQNQIATINICIQVKDLEHLNDVLNSIRSQISSIYEVKRISRN